MLFVLFFSFNDYRWVIFRKFEKRNIKIMITKPLLFIILTGTPEYRHCLVLSLSVKCSGYALKILNFYMKKINWEMLLHIYESLFASVSIIQPKISSRSAKKQKSVLGLSQYSMHKKSVLSQNRGSSRNIPSLNIPFVSML